ncbi:MAG: LacI family DNA-binding transcriptional regulator [Thermomicrobiales bacterium]
MNLEDIAKLAGVSRSTVSRVVNNDARVSNDVRARVREIIDRSNYHPNAAARSLATRRTRIVGLLIPQEVESIFVDSWFARLIQGCLRASTALDLSFMLMMEQSNNAEAVDRVVRRTIQGHHLDGIVISSSFVDDILVDRLTEEQFPYVIIGRDVQTRANFVDVDNRAASRHAVTHLLEHGRTRPAMIAGPDTMVAANDRRAGFQDALRALGFDEERVPIRHADWSQQTAFRMALELLDSPEPPDAFFAASDSMAIGVIQAIRSRGLRVPEDVNVMGFDDIDRERTTQLGLSTIEQPIDLVAATAIEMLLEQQESSQSRPLQRMLPTRLIIRTSCGCSAPDIITLPQAALAGHLTTTSPAPAFEYVQ